MTALARAKTGGAAREATIVALRGALARDEVFRELHPRTIDDERGMLRVAADSLGGLLALHRLQYEIAQQLGWRSISLGREAIELRARLEWLEERLRERQRPGMPGTQGRPIREAGRGDRPTRSPSNSVLCVQLYAAAWLAFCVFSGPSQQLTDGGLTKWE
jgi:hypothetical protein